MLNFDVESQQNTNVEFEPLITNFIKKHPEHKESVFYIISYKMSSSGDWIILDVWGNFSVLVFAESRQGKYLLELFDEALEKDCPLAVKYDKSVKSKCVVAIDITKSAEWVDMSHNSMGLVARNDELKLHNESIRKSPLYTHLVENRTPAPSDKRTKKPRKPLENGSVTDETSSQV